MTQRYNPELQKKALANREKRQQEFDDFTAHLKELSKSDKPSKLVHAPLAASATARRLVTDLNNSLDCTEGMGCEESRGGRESQEG